MWSKIIAVPGSLYVLQLCQGPDRVRYVRPREAVAGEPDPNRQLETKPFQGELVTAYNFRAIAEVRLDDGRQFDLGHMGNGSLKKRLQL
jgi:hypothetical protein